MIAPILHLHFQLHEFGHFADKFIIMVQRMTVATCLVLVAFGVASKEESTCSVSTDATEVGPALLASKATMARVLQTEESPRPKFSAIQIQQNAQTLAQLRAHPHEQALKAARLKVKEDVLACLGGSMNASDDGFVNKLMDCYKTGEVQKDKNKADQLLNEDPSFLALSNNFSWPVSEVQTSGKAYQFEGLGWCLSYAWYVVCDSRGYAWSGTLYDEYKQRYEYPKDYKGKRTKQYLVQSKGVLHGMDIVGADSFWERGEVWKKKDFLGLARCVSYGGDTGMGADFAIGYCGADTSQSSNYYGDCKTAIGYKPSGKIGVFHTIGVGWVPLPGVSFGDNMCTDTFYHSWSGEKP